MRRYVCDCCGKEIPEPAGRFDTGHGELVNAYGETVLPSLYDLCSDCRNTIFDFVEDMRKALNAKQKEETK